MSERERGGGVFACRVLGHRFRFWAEGPVMVWSCSRGCGEGGTKEYSSPERARHFARAFDVADDDDLGRRAPLVGLFPMRIARVFRRRRQARERGQR